MSTDRLKLMHCKLCFMLICIFKVTNPELDHELMIIVFSFLECWNAFLLKHFPLLCVLSSSSFGRVKHTSFSLRIRMLNFLHGIFNVRIVLCYHFFFRVLEVSFLAFLTTLHFNCFLYGANAVHSFMDRVWTWQLGIECSGDFSFTVYISK